MVKITYDENNKEERELVKDYFWYKYYVSSLKFDWGHIDLTCDFQRRLENLGIIKKHLNKYELKRAIKIHKNIYSKDMKRHINWNYFLSDNLLSSINCVKILKYNLTRNFKH